MKPSVMYTTCASKKEADKIAKSLLDKRLVSCVKQLPVNSTFLWKGKQEKANEIMLLLETFEDNFDQIEREIRKLHSYETFILFSIPVKISEDVRAWMDKEIR